MSFQPHNIIIFELFIQLFLPQIIIPNKEQKGWVILTCLDVCLNIMFFTCIFHGDVILLHE